MYIYYNGFITYVYMVDIQCMDFIIYIKIMVITENQQIDKVARTILQFSPTLMFFPVH